MRFTVACGCNRNTDIAMILLFQITSRQFRVTETGDQICVVLPENVQQILSLFP